MPPAGLDEIKRVYGDIRVDRVNGKLEVVAPPHWEEKNMAIVRDLPGFGPRPLYVNRLILDPLYHALELAKQLFPYYLIQTLGCFNPRKKRTNGAELSLHSWGVAVDLNPDKNPLQHLVGPNDKLVTDIPDEWLQAFRQCGFTWGGEFRGVSKDPMHFQYASGY